MMQKLLNHPKVDKRHDHPKLDRNITPLPGEIWRDITEWKGKELREGYQVSNLGRVRNLGRVIRQQAYTGTWYDHVYPPCMLRFTIDEDGYYRVSLSYVDRKVVMPGVHQLVATLFLHDQPRPDQTHVNHIDGNKGSNRPENLEWASPYENNKHARETGLARLGTSQAHPCRIVEWGIIYASKAKANEALGRDGSYIQYHLEHNIPIVDRASNQVVHVEFVTKEDYDEYCKF